MCRKRCVYSLHEHMIWENISFNRHVWIAYMERTTQCFWMLPEAQQFLIGSCQSKSLSTWKQLCVRMATRSKQTRRKPRTRHPSLLKNGCNVLNSETGLLCGGQPQEKNIIHRANRFLTRKSPNGLLGNDALLLNSLIGSFSSGNDWTKIAGLQALDLKHVSWRCSVRCVSPKVHLRNHLGFLFSFGRGYVSSHWWLTSKVLNAGLGHWSRKAFLSLKCLNFILFHLFWAMVPTKLRVPRNWNDLKYLRICWLVVPPPGVPCIPCQVGRYLLSPGSRFKNALFYRITSPLTMAYPLLFFVTKLSILYA